MEESLRILKPYLRGLPLIVFAMITGYLIMAQYLKYVTPKFESVTRLRLADIGEGVPNSNLFKDFDVFVTSNKIAAEIEVLKSQMLLDKTLNHLDFDIEMYRVGKMRTTELYNDSPFKVEFLSLENRLYDRTFNLQISQMDSFTLIHPDGNEFHAAFGDTLELTDAKLILSLNKPFIDSRNNVDVFDDYQFKKLSRSELISQVKGDLSVMPVDKDVAVIRLIFASPHPVKAARLPDILAQSYIEDYINTKSEAARVTMNFLDDQVNEVSRKLSQIERDIEAYRNQENITNIRQESETILREVSQMKIQQTNLLMSLEAINELNRYMQEGADNFETLAPNFEAFTDLLSTELIKKIKELRAEKRDLLLIFTPREERVQVIDQKLDDIYAYLLESISNTRRNLEIKFENLSRDITLAELQLIDYPEKERLLIILQREFEIYQASYNFLNEKKIEAEIAHAASISFHRIIEQAKVPKLPFSPNYVVLKIVAALLAAGGMIVLIFLVHTIKARVNDKLTIETTSAIPVVASTPRLKNIRSLQMHFLHQVNQLEVKKLLMDKNIYAVNAFSDKEGRSFHALHLAEALSKQNRNILFIDTENTLGLSNGDAGVLESLSTNLSIVHLNKPEYLFYTNEQISTLIKDLGKGFDMTIISNADIGTQLSLQVMKSSDVNFVVVDSRLTPSKHIPLVDLLKEEFGFDQMYFILNRFAYNPNIVFEFLGWVQKKAGLKQNLFKSVTYV